MATLGVEKKHKVTVIGSGNWGSTISKIVAENTKAHPDIFEEQVNMWVYEEEVVLAEDSPYHDPAIGSAPQKLTHIINTHHENTKYLPGIRLPNNLVANPSVVEAARDSTILIFNLPHQFIGKVCDQLRGHILPFARGISCIKGVNVSDDGVSLFSEWIGDGLGIYVGALSGANIASEIAAEKWSETTVAYDPPPMDYSRVPTPSANSRTASPGPNSPTVASTMANGANKLLDGLRALTPAELQHKDARGRASKTKLTPLPATYPPLEKSYPLFTAVHEILEGRNTVDDIPHLVSDS